MLNERLITAIKEQSLPTDFITTIQRHFIPIARNINERAHSRSKPLIVGIQGCQGSGKTTLASMLKILLEQQAGLNTAVLSIDDFYLTRSERTQLAKDKHPLLKTRGVPGTHDTELIKKTLSALQKLSKGEKLYTPLFDKALDDRAPESQWPGIQGPIDIIILEGWCVGIRAQESSELKHNVNSVEATLDANQAWRRFVNETLATRYSRLFDRLDLLIVLLAPSFESVYQWRLLQEQKLKQKTNLQSLNTPATQIMSPEQIHDFILLFQRLTEHANETLPQQADWLLKLDGQHTITSSNYQTDNHRS